jgi:translocation and assembly module TamB
LNGSATVTGSLDAPKIDADLSLGPGAIETTSFDGARLQATYSDNAVRVNAEFNQTASNRLTVRGIVPLSAMTAAGAVPDEGMSLDAESTPIDVGFIQAFTSEIDAVKGTGQFAVHVTGTVRQPAVTGRAVLAGVGFNVAATGAAFKNGQGTFEFTGPRVTLDRVSIEDEDGHPVTADGALDLVAYGGAPSTVNITITTRDLHLLNNRYGVLKLDADLHARGNLLQPDVSGSVRVTDGRLEVDQLLQRYTNRGYQSEADVTTTAPAPAPATPGPASPDPATNAAPSAAPAAPGKWNDSTMDLRIDLPNDLVLRGRNLRTQSSGMGFGDMNVTLGGEIAVKKARDEAMTLVGVLKVVRGSYQFQGRRFTIARDSEIRFQGPQPTNPSLNITANRDISGVTVEVRILATLDRPRIQLSSTPPLDEGDILSLIAFNQPINELGASQRIDIGQRAGELAAGMVASPLSSAVARALNLDEFEIRPPGDNSQAASVAVARQVGDRVYIGLKQNFGENDASLLSFEYQLTNALRLVTTVAQGAQAAQGGRRGDTTGVDVIYVIRR